MSFMIQSIQSFFTRYLEELRSSQLLMLLTGLLVLDLIVPDPLPLLDEAVLGLVTLMVTRFKMRARPERGLTDKPPPENVTPPTP